MRHRLSDTYVKALALKEAHYEVRDIVVRGLTLRVGAKGGRGAKVWEVIVPTGPKSRRRVRLGSFPAMSVQEARLAAAEAKDDVTLRERAPQVLTVADLFARYEANRATRLRSWRDVKSVWETWGRPVIGHVRLADVTLRHGLELREHVSAKSSPLRGASVIRYLRPMFAWAEEEQHLRTNPWATLKAREVATARDRVLTDVEWTRIWAAAEAEPYPFGPFVMALMLSAQRLSTVAAMRWDELHGDVWTIPAAKMKATRTEKAAAHEVPLSEALAALIAWQPRVSDFVFTTTGTSPITPGSRLKDRLEAAVNKRAEAEKGSPLSPSEILSDWRFHDLRRSAATKMTGAGATRFVVERVLGHADRGVTAIYDRSTYREEKRAALELLAGTLPISAPKGAMPAILKR